MRHAPSLIEALCNWVCNWVCNWECNRFATGLQLCGEDKALVSCGPRVASGMWRQMGDHFEMGRDEAQRKNTVPERMRGLMQRFYVFENEAHALQHFSRK